ncbi:MAG: PhoH family protein [Clostridia bacterium]|jgi:phosphate starvation-inducible PhoH-like protein|nr:PhoH family protein [Clostridia bacterium]MBQ5601855.1 PhoH family protein [Clostridia bacterium]
MIEKIIPIDSAEQLSSILGSYDKNIELIEKHFGVRIAHSFGNADSLSVSGDDERSVDLALTVINYLKRISTLGEVISEQKVEYTMSMIEDGKAEELAEFDSDCVCITAKGKPIKAKTVGQKKYVSLIKKNTLVFGIGPAGTGKTFLAVAMAVSALRRHEISRIVLTRPAVEAGERLGYLPGDLQSKIDPYLRPLYDALYETMGAENYLRNVEKGIVEVAPLAYMRGRTLDDCFIILDEAQNTTPEQMKMFLTRLGNNSKAVVTGDITQTDLPRGNRSGLKEALSILDGIEDISIHRFSERDVVRHRLVRQIILAYDKYEKDRLAKNDSDKVRRFKKTDGENS